ncbi:unnamed protein product [Pleuronectes platessa]|uniref:Uncharacterized protein n=1 Tax=Pleuronectes platessa TaxID=8262 RepID=A0A9N7YQH2_PLEPL|nr:unnamed protein product [Pleuronectes platessa]
MPAANGTQKCWQSIMMGLLGPREVEREDIGLEEEPHCGVYETINWNGRGGKLSTRSVDLGVRGSLRGTVGKPALLGECSSRESSLIPVHTDPDSGSLSARGCRWDPVKLSQLKKHNEPSSTRERHNRRRDVINVRVYGGLDASDITVRMLGLHVWLACFLTEAFQTHFSVWIISESGGGRALIGCQPSQLVCTEEAEAACSPGRAAQRTLRAEAATPRLAHTSAPNRREREEEKSSTSSVVTSAADQAV